MSRLHERRGDAGTTMTELVVVMFIMSVVVLATATLTIGFERTNAQTNARQEQIDAGRNAMDRMTRTLRVAVKPSQLAASCTGCAQDAFISGQPYSVQFYSNLENVSGTVGPSRVTYTIGTVAGRAGVLTERVQRPDSATPTTSGWTYCNAEAAGAPAACRARLTTRVLAQGVATTGVPLLTYFDENGAALTVPSTGLTAEQLQRVMSIELTLRLTSQGVARPEPTTFVQRVLLTNSHALLRPNPGATP